MTTCPFCAAPLPYAASYHVRACEQIMLGLLQEQVEPTVEKKPGAWTWV